jgi:hypothetical protein
MPDGSMSALERLKAIGFLRAGCWNCLQGGLAFDLEERLRNATNILYAFVVGGQVVYVGKSVRSLRERMNGYRNPSSTQSTNIRNNERLRESLNRGATVEVFVLPDNGLLHYGGFHVNLAAGLEDALIRDLQPLWNGGKKEGSPAPVEERS